MNNPILRSFVLMSVLMSAPLLFCMNQEISRKFTLINNTLSEITLSVGIDGKVFPIQLASEAISLPFSTFDSLSIGRANHTPEVLSKLQDTQNSVTITIQAPDSGLLGLGSFYNPYNLEIDTYATVEKREQQTLPTYSELRRKFEEDFKHALNALKANPNVSITAAFAVGLAPHATFEQINDLVALKRGYWENAYRKAYQKNQSLLPLEAEKRATDALLSKFRLSADRVAQYKAANDSVWTTTLSFELSRLQDNLVGDQETTSSFRLARRGLTLYNLVKELNDADKKIAGYRQLSYAALGSTVSANIFPGTQFEALPSEHHRAAGQLLLEQAIANRAKLAEKLRGILLAEQS